MRLAAVAAVAGLVALVPAVVGAGAMPITTDGTMPLTNIDISNDLNCTVNYQDDGPDEWFTNFNSDTGQNDPDACGTFVALSGGDGPATIYGPAGVPGADTLTSSRNYNSYTVPTDDNGSPDNQVHGGSGTQDDPYTITTTVLLGETGLELVETDSYIDGQNSYRTDVTLTDTGSNFPFDATIYRAGDCFLQNQDEGLGSVQNGNAPICNGADQLVGSGGGGAFSPGERRAAAPLAPAAAPDPTARIEGMYPIGDGSRYLEGYFDCVWQDIRAGGPFPNVQDAGATSNGDGCAPEDPGGTAYDNGLGLSWPATLASNDSTTVSALNVFSPGGAAPLTVTKTADNPGDGMTPVRVGDSDGYTITISNPGDQPETLDDITDVLPASFSYKPGSTTVDGAAFDDANMSTDPLDWSGPFTVPASSGGTAGTVTLHFDVSVGTQPGQFRNSASAAGQDLTVNPATDVAPVTVSPKAVDDGVYTTPYETATTVPAASGLLANDVPNDGHTTVDTTPVTAPQHGAVKVNADGSFTYTPANGYTGGDSFTYRDTYHFARTDRILKSNTATVSLTVQAPPAPVAVNDSYSTDYETQLKVNAANGVLKNDTVAPDQPAPTVDTTTVSNPVHGTVIVNTDGSFTYKPNPGFTGMDTFTYKNKSAGVQSNQASVTVTVGPSPAPVTRDDNYTTPYETKLIVGSATGLLANDTPPKDQTNAVDLSTVTVPSHGTVLVNADGSFTYTPNAGYIGPDSFTYRDIGNGVRSNLPPATVSITVGHSPAPVANNDDYTTPFGTALTVGTGTGLLSNDLGPPHQTLTVSPGSVVGPMHGTVSVNANGSFTYMPNSGFTGTDTFAYKNVAAGLQSNQATVSVTVGRDPRPTAVDDGPLSVDRNGHLTVPAPGVLSNDVDPNGLSLTAVQPTNPSHGTVALNADGSFTYTPTHGYSGPDSFTYKARNSDGDTSATAATVSFNVVDQAPDAGTDVYIGQQDTVLTISAAAGVLSNDTDPNGDPLTATLVDPASSGAVVLNADGSFTYSPALGFTGTATFTYRASDGTLSSSTTTVFIDVRPPPPTAVDDSYSVDKNATLTEAAGTGVLANDTPQNGTLSASKISDPSHGSVTLNADGSFAYTPTHGFSGTDTFTYRDIVGEDSSDPATVTIQVNDQAPVAQPDSYTTAQDTTLTVPVAGVLGNDTDPNNDSLTAALVTAANHGAVTLHSDGSFTYSPVAGFHGTATFTYQASDGTLTSSAATVTITVTKSVPPPPPPTSPSTSTTPPPPPVSSPVPPPPPPVNTTPVVVPPPVQVTTPVIVPPPTTPTTPPPSSSTTTPPPPSHSTLKLSSPSVNPGGQLTAIGNGCTPNSTVLVSVNGRPAGHGTADGSGAFTIPASAPNLPVGNYTVVATCGNRQLTTQVALVFVVGASSTPAAQTLTVATLLAFFILLLGLVLRRPTSR